MSRILIDYLLPVFAPTLAWLAWLSWRQRHGVKSWDEVPWAWLLIAGGALALLITIGGTLIAGYGTGHYHPARVDATGHIVPGGFD